MYKIGAAVTSVIVNHVEIGQNIRINSIVTESFTAKSIKEFLISYTYSFFSNSQWSVGTYLLKQTV